VGHPLICVRGEIQTSAGVSPWRQKLVDHEHDFGGLDDCGDLVSHLDAEILYALPGDDALDEIFTHADRHLGSNYSKNNCFYLASQLITRRYFHGSDCISLGVHMAEAEGSYGIAPARWPEDAEHALRLLTNYGRYLAASPVAAAGMCFADYEAQLRGLPGKYAEADADLLLARINGEVAGCAALTPRILNDGAAAELKRLWVEPRFRRYGLGRGLVMAAIDWARTRGYPTLLLDTVNEAMPEASALYQSLGFEETGRFNDNPIPGVRFYKFKVTGDQ
jgi:putative acetyltransferase